MYTIHIRSLGTSYRQYAAESAVGSECRMSNLSGEHNVHAKIACEFVEVGIYVGVAPQDFFVITFSKKLCHSGFC